MHKKLILIFLTALIFRCVLAFIVWHPDLNSNADWGIRFFEYGAGKFYAPESNVWSFTWPNQPPGTIYMYAGIYQLFRNLFNLFSLAHFNLHFFPGKWLLFLETNLYPALLKLPAILADIGIATLIYKIVKQYKKDKALFGAALFLFNPIIWYNSAVWGQTDAVISFFALLCLYLIFKNKIFWAILSLLLCFYIKISLLIFLPVFVIVLLKKVKLSSLLAYSLIGLLVIGLVTLPFSHGEPFGWLVWVYETKVLGQQLQIITANAFNIWASIAGINEQPQTLPFLGLTYQYWGYILFGVSFLPILYRVYKKQDMKTVIWALALTAFASWLLLTNMHERYLYPLFPYLTILVPLSGVSIYPYILISLVSLLNLYNFWWTPKIDFIVNFLSFGERLMPRIFGIVNFILFLKLYVSGVFERHGE